MDERDDHYYEANKATIDLHQIASCDGNAQILWRLRDGYESSIEWEGKHEEVGWLGYFIGKSRWLQELSIHYMPKGEQQTSALVVGIARNQSIRTLDVDAREGLSDDDFSVLCAGILIKLSQLEVLDFCSSNSYCCSALGTALRLRSGTLKLKDLRLSGNIGDIGVASLGNGFRARLSIGLATAKTNELEGARYLGECGINDQGLQAFAEGVANHCEELRLSYNDSITATGLSHLSHVLRSESCRLQRLSLNGMDFGDDGAKALGVGLAGNQSLRRLHFDNTDTNLPMTPIG
eukprot:scaffold20087_cov73-Skeletonema_marinoi.AAC.1